MTGFHETANCTECGSQKTKIVVKNREVDCPKKALTPVCVNIWRGHQQHFKADQEPPVPAMRVMLSKEFSEHPPDQICVAEFLFSFFLSLSDLRKHSEVF